MSLDTPTLAIPLTTAFTRIPIRDGRSTPKPPSSTAEPMMDFWSFTGAAANVIMQLSWPEVGHGVLESRVPSGAVTVHPWKRARTTSQYLAVALLGSAREKRAFREAIDRVHRQVRSDAHSPVHYNAFSRELQLWVAACLYVGVEDTHQLLHGRLTAERAERLYRASITLGTTLQVPPDMWPATRADFDDYWNSACARVSLDHRVRRYLLDLIELRMINPLIAAPMREPMTFLTVGFLAPVFREQLGISWSTADQGRFEAFFTTVSLANTMLPLSLRQAPARLSLWDVRRRVRRGRELV